MNSTQSSRKTVGNKKYNSTQKKQLAAAVLTSRTRMYKLPLRCHWIGDPRPEWAVPYIPWSLFYFIFSSEKEKKSSDIAAICVYVCVCACCGYIQNAQLMVSACSVLFQQHHGSRQCFLTGPRRRLFFFFPLRKTDFQQTIIIFSFSGGIPADEKGENSAGKIWPNYTQLPILLAI